jgi:hypothetical protein
MDLIQVYRNGLAQGPNDIQGISYAAPPVGSPAGTPGLLTMTTAVAWPATDTVTAVWVFPFQSVFVTPTK